MAKIRIEDNSGDKEFFTIIPNYIANHSTANDQALYFQMKKYAGESGKCFATEKTLMGKLGIGKKAYDKSLQYLLEKNWIAFLGTTQGKTRPIKTYKINNIWSMNNNFYKKISAESTLSNKKISAESNIDKFQKQHKISAESNVEQEPYKQEPVTRERTPSQIAKSFFKGETEEMFNELKDKIPLNEDLLQQEFQKFILYWTEPNKSGTKERWELQKTFDVKRRLSTWLGNMKNFQNAKTKPNYIL